MNTSIQLYNTSLSPNMCPLWPEMPSLGNQMQLFPCADSKLGDVKLQAENETTTAAFEQIINYIAAPAIEVYRTSQYFLPCLSLDLLSCANYFVWGANKNLIKSFPKGQQTSLEKIHNIAFSAISDLKFITAGLVARECAFGNPVRCVVYITQWFRVPTNT